jgi:hypothetical protein
MHRADSKLPCILDSSIAREPLFLDDMVHDTVGVLLILAPRRRSHCIASIRPGFLNSSHGI